MASERTKNVLTYLLVAVILLAGVGMISSIRYSVTFNKTSSLEYVFFITDKSTKPHERGQYVKFNLTNNKYFPRAHWTKRIEGVPGDTITVTNREIFINGKSMGRAKEQSLSGTPCFPIAAQIIPPGYYYLKADHEDSYDSRYKTFGLVNESSFIGREYPIF